MEESYFLEGEQRFATPKNAEPFSVRWNADDSLLAVGLGDGTCALYLDKAATPVTTMDCRNGSDMKMPVTWMRWRPQEASVSVLLTVNAEGSATHWHATTGKALHTTQIEGEQFHCLDYRSDGMEYAVGTKKGAIKVFDEATKSENTTLHTGTEGRRGHGNRVFSLKYISEFELVSAGWDANVLVWDLRTGHAEQVFYGPYVTSDTLDVQDDLIMVGSHANHNQITFISRETMAKVNQIELEGERPCNVYTWQFSKSDNGSIFLAAGKGGNEAHFFSTKTFNKFTECVRYPKAIYCADFSHTERKAVLGCADGILQFYNYAPRIDPEMPEVVSIDQSAFNSAIVPRAEESKN